MAIIKGKVKAISVSRQRGTKKFNVPLAQLEGDFAENITTEGIDLQSLKVGSGLRLGDEAEVEITQFGKECHSRCEIFEQVGDCVMPREGIFAKVTKAGSVNVGDIIEVIADND